MENNVLDIELSGEIFGEEDFEAEVVKNFTESLVIRPIDNGKFLLGKNGKSPIVLENTGLPYVGEFKYSG